MILERSYQDWLAKRGASGGEAHAMVSEVAKRMAVFEADDLVWLADSLTDAQRKFFTAALFSETGTLPESLYEPMLHAAVYEPSPLQAHAFVEPCVKSFGVKRVHQTLMDYLGAGSNYEKTGAVNALHWCGERKTGNEIGRSQTDAEMVKLAEIQHRLYLRTFVDNTDIELRRALITHADLNVLAPTMPVQELIDKVVRIARAHPDQYIRNRVEVQLGRATSQYTLPPRKAISGIMHRRKASWWTQLWK